MSDEHQNDMNPKPLSSKQERKLMDYVEDRFLDITRNFKKRSVISIMLLDTLCHDGAGQIVAQTLHQRCRHCPPILRRRIHSCP